MEVKSKINIRGTIRKMRINEVLEFPRPEYRASSVRSTAALVKEDYGMAYSISVNQEKIVVTRIS
jgi:hypothetical protein